MEAILWLIALVVTVTLVGGGFVLFLALSTWGISALLELTGVTRDGKFAGGRK